MSETSDEHLTPSELVEAADKAELDQKPSSTVMEVATDDDVDWSQLSDEELHRAVSEFEAGADDGGGTLKHLAPVLVQKFMDQDGSCEEKLLPSKSTYECLKRVAKCSGDDVVPHVLPFVTSNIANENWKYRAAALMAFGAILSGLKENTRKALMEKHMPTLIEAVYDASIGHIAAWTFERVCEMVPEDVANESYLTPILKSVVEGLSAVDPRVATNVYDAFASAIQTVYTEEEVVECKTYCFISTHFDDIIERLLDTIDRQDAQETLLKPAAYIALMVMVYNAPAERKRTVQKTTMVLLERLQDIFSSECDRFENIRSYLCVVLESVIKGMPPEDAEQMSTAIITALLTILAHNGGKDGRVSRAALEAAATVADVLGEEFAKHMDAFKNYLYMALKDHQKCNVFHATGCQAAVSVVGYICRALKSKALPYCDEIVGLLIDNVRLHGPVNQMVVFVLGEIALSIGPHFAKYFDDVMPILEQAGNTEVESFVYSLEIHRSVLESYKYIIQGLKMRPDAALVVEPYLPEMVRFMGKVASLAHVRDHLEPLVGLTVELRELFAERRDLLPALTRPMLEFLLIAHCRVRLDEDMQVAAA